VRARLSARRPNPKQALKSTDARGGAGEMVAPLVKLTQVRPIQHLPEYDPFHQKSTCITRLTLGRYVVQI